MILYYMALKGHALILFLVTLVSQQAHGSKIILRGI